MDETTTDLIDPTTCEVIAATDPDALIDALERIRGRKSELAAAERSIIEAIYTQVSNLDGKTRRLRGARRRCKITLPDASWDQPALKFIWEQYPQYRGELLRVERVGVNIREYRKALNEVGRPDFQECVRAIVNAERQPTGLPSVAIEENINDE